MAASPLRSPSVKTLATCVTAAFAVVSGIGFLLIPLSSTFWIAYAFTGLSYATVVAVGILSSTPRSGALLHMLPSLTVAAAYAGLQSITGLVLALVRPQPRTALVICLALALLFAVALTLLYIVSSTIESVERNVADKRDFKDKALLQLSVCKANLKPELAQTKTLLDELDEMVRYSDPMGTNETKDIEQTLMKCVEELALLVASGYSVTSSIDEKAAELCRKATGLLTQRNELCKMTK